MESPSETKETLAKLFSPFGRIVDIVLHLDDVSSQWFRGNGHILVETRESDPNNNSPSYRLDYNGKTSILVTWAKMPKHCRYCKAMGHTRETCSERPSEVRTCFTCGIKGHLRVNCTRAPPTEPESSKRSRRIAPDSSITTRSILTPRLTSQRQNTSQYSKWAPVVDKASTNTTDTSLEVTDPVEEHSSTAASTTHSDGDADMGSTEPDDPSLTHSDDDDDVDMQGAEDTITNDDLSPPINTDSPNADLPDQSSIANTSGKQFANKSSKTTSTIPTRSSPRKNKGLHSGRLDPGNSQHSEIRSALLTESSEYSTTNDNSKNINLRIGSLNCRSLAKPNQPTVSSEFIRFLRSQSFDLVTLQETHASDLETQQTLDMKFQAKSSIWSRHCGIVSLNSSIVLSSSLISIDQRLIACTISHIDQVFEPFTIVTIYTPASPPLRRKESFLKDTNTP
ncbi:hypothetical protein G6F15_012447 [Rhizopus arrhizus]|nr:hypothetical protein G6F15_012447 [Rhizopus arrhizus]